MQISFGTISIKIFNKQNYSTSYLNHTVKLNILSQICNLFKPYQQLFTMLSTSTKQPQKNTSVHHDVQRRKKDVQSSPQSTMTSNGVETFLRLRLFDHALFSNSLGSAEFDSYSGFRGVKVQLGTDTPRLQSADTCLSVCFFWPSMPCGNVTI